MLWYNNRYTGLADMVQTLEYLTLHGGFNWEAAQTVKMSSRAERIRSTRYASQVQVAVSDPGSHLRTGMGLGWSEPGYCTSRPIFIPEARDKPGMSQLLKRTTLARKASNMKPLSLGEAAMRFGINDLPIILRDRIVDMWGTYLVEKILGPAETYAENVFIEVYNSLANLQQPYQRPLQVEKG
jgi:hypothetical protein